MATSYCVLADVQTRIGVLFTIGGASSPTTTEVNEFITQKSAKINAAMRRARYGTIPATGADDLLELKDVVANAVALQSLFIHYPTSRAVPEGAVTRLSGFREFIKNLGNGDVWLSDQSPTRSGLHVAFTQVYSDDD